MTFWIGRFIIEWVVWLSVADKRRWREILPVCLFASYISLIADQLSELFELWQYYPKDCLADLLNAIGIYMIATYLFIQWLPCQKTYLNLFCYFFCWTIIAVSIEFIHVYFGYMKHLNWSYGYSYAADWALFWLFYKFYFATKKYQNN